MLLTCISKSSLSSPKVRNFQPSSSNLTQDATHYNPARLTPAVRHFLSTQETRSSETKMASNPNKSRPAIESKPAGQRRQPTKASVNNIGLSTPSGPGVQASQMHHAGQTASIAPAAGRPHLPAINTTVPPAHGAARGTPDSALRPQSGTTQPIGSAAGSHSGRQLPTPAPRTGGNGGMQRQRNYAAANNLPVPVVHIPAKTTTENGVMSLSQSHRS